MLRIKNTTRLITTLLIVAVLTTNLVPALPMRCSEKFCTPQPGDTCCCSHSARQPVSGQQHSCCQPRHQQRSTCCDARGDSKQTCRCNRDQPNPTTPTAPQQRDTSRHLQLMLSFDAVELCLEAPVTQSAPCCDTFPLPIPTTPLSILYCTWLV